MGTQIFCNLIGRLLLYVRLSLSLALERGAQLALKSFGIPTETDTNEQNSIEVVATVADPKYSVITLGHMKQIVERTFAGTNKSGGGRTYMCGINAQALYLRFETCHISRQYLKKIKIELYSTRKCSNSLKPDGTELYQAQKLLWGVGWITFGTISMTSRLNRIRRKSNLIQI